MSVDHLCDGAIANSLHSLVNNMQRHQEPFPRLYRAAKSVGYGQLYLDRAEQPMEKIFHPRAIEVVQFVGGNRPLSSE